MKVFLDMVGCRLNQSELEIFAHQFRLAGHTLTSEVGSADLVVINTCTVTGAAASDSRQKIRQAARAGNKQIIATGCWASLNPRETAELPGVSMVIGNLDKDHLVSSVLNIPTDGKLYPAIQHEPIPGVRQRTRAFIKVQDGCDNHCTYCITRVARGPSRSRRTNEILIDIQSALDGGAKEIVLTGVHLGSWGYDFDIPSHLTNLVTAILNDTDTSRLHLSSLEPWDITPAFLELWHSPRLCRHLHLPLQSGCETTLKRMRRRITPDAYANLIQSARAIITDVAITTDIITGFPGETETEFSKSAAFIENMDFANGHVFTFSARPGTVAEHLPDQIPHNTAKQRNARIRGILLESSSGYHARQIGKYLPVLWEKASPTAGGHWELSGLSDNYFRVRAPSPIACRNEVMDVHITGLSNGELVGEIIPTHSRVSSYQDTL
jgi:threonylcarbamoyladenosine tRNA methylthiotransferase MtaB